MISRPKEMLTLLSALLPEAKLKMKDFGERYCLSTNPKAYSKYDGTPLVHSAPLGLSSFPLYLNLEKWYFPRGAQTLL